MNKLYPLLKIQLMGFFNFNKIKHSDNHKEKRTAILFLIGAVLLGLLMESYLIGMVLGWSYLGLTESIPSLLTLITALVCFVLTFMKSNGTLFGFKDYDLLISLPISPRLLITSRLLFVYLLNFVFSIISFFLPMIVFWMQGYFSLSSLVMTFLALFMLPIVPMIAAMFIGVLITAIASLFRYTNLVIVLISTLLIILLLLSSFSFNQVDLNQLNKLGKLIEEVIHSFYPLAIWLNKGIVQNNWLYFSFFIVVSLFSGLLFVFILGKFYLTLNARLSSFHKKNSFTWTEAKQKTPLMALYKREWSLYLSSPLYVMNTAFGSIMLITFSIALFFFPLSKLGELLKISNLEGLIQPYLFLVPIILSFFVVVGTTTASSISMEGKYRWQLVTLPIPLKSIFQAKLLLNFSIVIPAILISGICLGLKFQMNCGLFLCLFILPTAYALFGELVGLLMDCIYAKFDWTSEQQVVKQSFANLLTLGINSLALALGFVLTFLFSSFPFLGLSLISIVLLSCSLFIYRKILTKNPFMFQ